MATCYNLKICTDSQRTKKKLQEEFPLFNLIISLILNSFIKSIH